MKITFNGKAKNPKILKCELREAATFYAKLLMSERLIRSLHINIDFRKDLGNDMARCCAAVDQLSEKNPRNFIIEIDERLPLKPTFIALAHEMVHVKQHATGQAYSYVNNPHLVRWAGKKINTNSVEYWDSPWEIEAFGRERGLYARYKDAKTK